jgi:uncharacterized membrane protein
MPPDLEETSSSRGRGTANNSFFAVDADLLCLIIYFFLALAFIVAIPLNSTIYLILGVPIVTFIPGYVSTIALFPGKFDITNVERAALSIGLSLAITSLLGLLLNWGGVALRLVPYFVCIAGVLIILAVIASLRRRALPRDQQFSVGMAQVRAMTARFMVTEDDRFDRIISVALILMIIISMAALGFVIAVPKQAESNTEFYILNNKGEAANYSTQATIGQTMPFVVGVINHEYRDMNYTLMISLSDGNQTRNLYTESINVKDGQKWEKTIGLVPDMVGNNLKLEFLLYTQAVSPPPYQECHVWVNVTK